MKNQTSTNTIIAIHTRTQDEWNAVFDAIGQRPVNPETRWIKYGEDTVVYPDTASFSSLPFAIKKEITVISMEQWATGVFTTSTDTDMKDKKRDEVVLWLMGRYGLTYDASCLLIGAAVAGCLLCILVAVRIVSHLTPIHG
jgi:hypothetical protein